MVHKKYDKQDQLVNSYHIFQQISENKIRKILTKCFKFLKVNTNCFILQQLSSQNMIAEPYFNDIKKTQFYLKQKFIFKMKESKNCENKNFLAQNKMQKKCIFEDPDKIIVTIKIHSRHNFKYSSIKSFTCSINNSTLKSSIGWLSILYLNRW